MRPRCYVPEGGALIESCTRTLQGRLLLRPDPRADEIILGVLGRALDRYHLDLCGFTIQAGHYHLLLDVETAEQMARFHCFLNSNLARKLGNLHDWPEKLWGRRYRPMAISQEPEAQRARLKYVLANGTKEGLVASPLDWPGPSMARAILDGEPLIGTWFNQTKEWSARRRGESFAKYDYATRYRIELQPLPSFRHLSRGEYRDLVAELVREIEEETAVERGDRPVFGARQIRAQNPHRRPRKIKKSPAPMLFFASTKDTAKAMQDDYKAFARQYAMAAERLRLAQLSSHRNLSRVGGRSDPRTGFPDGCFPPALQFTGKRLAPPPPRPPSRRLEYDETLRRIIGRGKIPLVTVPRVVASQGYPGQAGGCHDPPLSRPT